MTVFFYLCHAKYCLVSFSSLSAPPFPLFVVPFVVTDLLKQLLIILKYHLRCLHVYMHCFLVDTPVSNIYFYIILLLSMFIIDRLCFVRNTNKLNWIELNWNELKLILTYLCVSFLLPRRDESTQQPPFSLLLSPLLSQGLLPIPSLSLISFIPRFFSLFPFFSFP